MKTTLLILLVGIAPLMLAIPQGSGSNGSPSKQADSQAKAKESYEIEKKIDSCHTELKINVDILINRGVLPDSMKLD